MTTETGPARQGPTERCTCGHTKRDHSGRRDHRDKYGPTVAGRPWCHACETECIYCPPDPAEETTEAVGYCPACGHGDVAPTADEYEQQRQRAEQAEDIVFRVGEVAQWLRRNYPGLKLANETLAAALKGQPVPGTAATQATDGHP